ncbi:MAG: acyl-CoA thioester hydrolase [Myxococcota bacterium]|jgi:acyl-CoA thioester hydrolase
MKRFHERVMGVYFDDLDPYHILHNARYLLLFERTLGSFWHSLGFGSLQEVEHPDRFHFVKANTVEYEQPVRRVGDVRVRVWVERLGSTSLTFGFVLMPMDSDEVHARGTRTVVRVDPDTWRPAPWTDSFRAILADWQ